MKLNLRRLAEPLKAYYDRGVAIMLLVALVVSALVLGLRTVRFSRDQRAFRQGLDRMPVRYPSVPPVDRGPYDRAAERVTSPSQFDASRLPTNHFLIPESRVSCKGCSKPVVPEALVCPFCKVKEPAGQESGPRPGEDHDGDGMTDVWEKENGFNPQDKDDGLQDADKDGFSNVEEYKAHEIGGQSTNPRDPNSIPPVYAYGKLVVTKIQALSFPFRFMGYLRTDGGYKFQLNGTNQTFWRKIGESIDGYKLAEFQEKKVRQEAPMRISKDVSELVLQKGESKVVLVIEMPSPPMESTATIRFLPDMLDVEVKVLSEFEVRRQKFRVKTIDDRQGRVVLFDLVRQKDVSINLSR